MWSRMSSRGVELRAPSRTLLYCNGRYWLISGSGIGSSAVAYQPLKGVVNLAVWPVIAHAVGIAVTAGRATGIAVAVIVALPVFRAIEHHVFQT